MSCLTWAYPSVKFGFHGHTDRGLGVANTRAAIFAGVAQIQGTLVGTGERCGNVNLTTVIGSMQLRGEAEFVSPDSLTGLTGLAHTGVRCIRTGSTARRGDCWPGRIRHLGGNARQQRAKKSRRLPVVPSGKSGRQSRHWCEWSVRKSKYHAAFRIDGHSAECSSNPGSD